jgi:lipoate---protein ligase
MKKAHNIYKSKKLIKVSLEYNEDSKIINSITITGDFFLYPEETLDELEASLIGTKLERDAIKQKIEKCLNGSEAFGFDSESMTDAILGCFKEEQIRKGRKEEKRRGNYEF